MKKKILEAHLVLFHDFAFFFYFLKSKIILCFFILKKLFILSTKVYEVKTLVQTQLWKNIKNILLIIKYKSVNCVD